MDRPAPHSPAEAGSLRHPPGSALLQGQTQGQLESRTAGLPRCSEGTEALISQLRAAEKPEGLQHFTCRASSHQRKGPEATPARTTHNMQPALVRLGWGSAITGACLLGGQHPPSSRGPLELVQGHGGKSQGKHTLLVQLLNLRHEGILLCWLNPSADCCQQFPCVCTASRLCFPGCVVSLFSLEFTAPGGRYTPGVALFGGHRAECGRVTQCWAGAA